jgi:hypothetical protein
MLGKIVEDVWRCMLSVSNPVPDGLSVDPEGPPSFYNPVVAYGPASHTAFCSTWRFIRFVEGAYPGWRVPGLKFAKFASLVALEHGMKQMRAQYRNFGIATAQRRLRARALLQRRLEKFGLDIAAARGHDPDADDETDTNRSYKDIPLTATVSLDSFPKGVTPLVAAAP